MPFESTNQQPQGMIMRPDGVTHSHPPQQWNIGYSGKIGACLRRHPSAIPVSVMITTLAFGLHKVGTVLENTPPYTIEDKVVCAAVGLSVFISGAALLISTRHTER